MLENKVLVNHLVDWLSPRKVRRTIVTGVAGALVPDTAEVSLTFWPTARWTAIGNRCASSGASPRAT